eukprot:g36605.t1
MLLVVDEWTWVSQKERSLRNADREAVKARELEIVNIVEGITGVADIGGQGLDKWGEDGVKMWGHRSGQVGRSVRELALILRKVKVSAPDYNGTTSVGGFDNKVRVGPEGAECGNFRRGQVRVGERSREVDMANVTLAVFNEEIEGRKDTLVLETAQRKFISLILGMEGFFYEER